jgi:hypothetical protein
MNARVASPDFLVTQQIGTVTPILRHLESDG